MIADALPGAQQQPDAVLAPLDQWPQEFLRQMGRVGSLVQGVDHGDHGATAGTQLRQQTAHPVTKGGRVSVDVINVDVINFRSRSQASQDLPGGQIPRVDGHADRVLAGYSICGDRKSTRLNSSHVKISYA